MFECNELYRKFVRMVPDDWTLPKEKTCELFKENHEFLRSLEAYIDLEFMKNIKLKEIDKKFLFLRYIAGIETLVMDRQKQSWDEFSNHAAWLLGFNIGQRTIIQNHLGTLYTIRNRIIHSLEIPRKNENFRKFFDSEFDAAINFASEYHRLILLRFIEEENSIGSVCKRIQILRELKKTLCFNITPSKYTKDIAKKVEEITKIPSPETIYQSYHLPDPEERYYIGIDTFGGLSTITHKTIGDYTKFYLNNDYIIPDENVWQQICMEVEEEKRKIRDTKFNEIFIIPKTHLSILFYIGHSLGNITKSPMFIDFLNKPFTLKPIDNYVDPNKYWDIKKKRLDHCTREIVTIINVTRYVDAYVREDLERLNLKNSPVLIFNYQNSTNGCKVDRQCIKDAVDIFEACRALECYLVDLQKYSTIARVHLFGRAPAAMMFLLGMEFKLMKLEVSLYERGKKNLGEEKKYYKVLECI